MPNYFPFGMPYWHFPYYRIPNRRKNSTTNINSSSTVNNCNSNINTNTNINASAHNNSSDNFSKNNCNNENNTSSINLLGFKFYSDDILIFCILFFLYTEGIKDEMLFICLILLLLS